MIFYNFSFIYTITTEVIKMEYPYAETGKRIMDTRLKLGLTRERLAEMSDISVQFLADIEKGKKSMTVSTLRNIAAALLVTTDFIVNGRECPDGDTEAELTEIFRVIPKEKQRYAIEILKEFAKALDK